MKRLDRRTMWLVALIAVAVIAPQLASGYRVFQLTQIVIAAIAVLGLNLVTGYAGQISLGHGAFYAVGAYVSFVLIIKAGLPYWATPPIAGAVSLGVGYLFGRSAARLEGLYLALATFALATALPQILRLGVLEPWTGGNQGIRIERIGSPLPGLVDRDRWLYYFCLAITIAMFVLARNIVRGRTGRALIALRDHPVAAATMGINVAAYKSNAFGVSAMYTGVAGSLGALTAGFIAPDTFTILLSIQILVGGVVGGISSIFGAVAGAAFIQLVPDLTQKLAQLAAWLGLDALSVKLADSPPAVLYGVLLVVFMMVMPGGVAGLVRSAQRRFARPTAIPAGGSPVISNTEEACRSTASSSSHPPETSRP